MFNVLKFKAMKKFVVLFICLTISLLNFGQNKQTELNEIRVTPPKFTGIINTVNEKSLTDYLIKNIKYEQDFNKSLEEGTEVVRFVISPNGKLSDFKIINSVSEEIDEELIRVLETTNGMWAPGLNDKNPIAMEKEVAVRFYVEYNIGVGSCTVAEHFTAMAIKYFNKGNKELLVNNNPKKALRAFCKASKYLPYDGALLHAQSITKFQLGDKEGAIADWNRMKLLAKSGKTENNLEVEIDHFNALNGYKEFLSFVDK